MASRTGNTATSTELIPAGHAALTAEEELGEHQSDTSAGLAGLSVAALGVVFGDIGTSPVYTFRECFNPERGLPLDAEHVLGVLSMIFWALIIVVAVKYVLLIMRADNQGEGGILALLALALEAARSERLRTLLVLLALGGAALFYGDPKGFRSPCFFCSSTNASAARSPTAASTTAPTPITSRPASSKPPTTAPIKLFNRSSISSPPDLSVRLLNSFCLRFSGLESRTVPWFDWRETVNQVLATLGKPVAELDRERLPRCRSADRFTAIMSSAWNAAGAARCSGGISLPAMN